jgi:hypothetical protein
MEKRIPPYFHNFDDSHCLQCSLRSILEYFNPDKTWSWEELEELSRKREGASTWHMGFLANLGKLGYEVVCIENFNLEQFVANPSEYMKLNRTQESYEWVMRTMDFDAEVESSKLLLKAQDEGQAELHYRNHTIEDIKHYLSKGYLLCYWVDGRKLQSREGYSGHFITLYGLEDNDHVRAHDSGGLYKKVQPIGRAEMKVSLEELMSCSYAGTKTGGLYALRPKNSK